VRCLAEHCAELSSGIGEVRRKVWHIQQQIQTVVIGTRTHILNRNTHSIILYHQRSNFNHEYNSTIYFRFNFNHTILSCTIPYIIIFLSIDPTIDLTSIIQ